MRLLGFGSCSPSTFHTSYQVALSRSPFINERLWRYPVREGINHILRAVGQEWGNLNLDLVDEGNVHGVTLVFGYWRASGSTSIRSLLRHMRQRNIEEQEAPVYVKLFAGTSGEVRGQIDSVFGTYYVCVRTRWELCNKDTPSYVTNVNSGTCLLSEEELSSCFPWKVNEFLWYVENNVIISGKVKWQYMRADPSNNGRQRITCFVELVGTVWIPPNHEFVSLFDL